MVQFAPRRSDEPAQRQEAVQSWNEARWQLLDAITGGGQAQLQIETANGLQRERSLQFAPGDVEPDGADLMTEAGLSLAAPKPQEIGRASCRERVCPSV